MKRITFLLPALFLVFITSSVQSQKYKRATDTVRLNKELLEVTNEIASLTSKLSIAQNNLPGYHTKATDAAADAQSTAQESSSQASKATNGDVGDAKRAKRKAKQALNDAKEARSADNSVKGQDHKIAKLTRDLEKKQAKLKELEDMRTVIRSAN
jgi:DNA repair exonuclease SbcCD ATPase subunit